ncbi:histidine kinase [Chitinophaga dinghuensis]|uniref:Histidine kinase n=1 Tax=Chitinophaga dinghuensis TaxID=1539050 RepID=A0A327WCV6_9BACT|nr:histidine kinase [Chitinophaga dinghuensis]RAJ87391.1 histidine kinase [Chitinophaga dinghuensis]
MAEILTIGSYVRHKYRRVAVKACWHILPVLFFYLIIDMQEYQPIWQPLMRAIALLFLLVVPYTNIYYLIPSFLVKARYKTYIVSSCILITWLFLLTIWTRPWFTPLLRPENSFLLYTVKDVLVFYVLMIFLLAASTVVSLLGQWLENRYYKAECLKKELENLKKQLSPHFLFNTLNNLDVLIYKDQDQASEVVHRLSGLLGYQLYLASNKNVSLQQEITMVEDFLFLEKLRHDRLEVKLDVNGAIANIQVPPLLLMPFVENAVKHNDYDGQAYIHLQISGNEGQLIFRCINAVGAVHSNEVGGSGLKNICRRLEILYPAHHTITIENKNKVFAAEIILDI